jgi:hypothetical protein
LPENYRSVRLLQIPGTVIGRRKCSVGGAGIEARKLAALLIVAGFGALFAIAFDTHDGAALPCPISAVPGGHAANPVSAIKRVVAVARTNAIVLI